MPTTEQISAVLGEIQDPELHRGLNELNMVRNIAIEGSQVTVLIALTIPGCPLKDYFHKVIPAKIKETYPDVTDVEVRADLDDRGGAPRPSSAASARTTPAPFARSDSRRRSSRSAPARVASASRRPP